MNRSHSWFAERAAQLWSAVPGRSICCLVPGGNGDASRFPAFLENWIPAAFSLPPTLAHCRTLVVRLVPDHSTSAARVVERIRQKIGSATGQSLEIEAGEDPGEALDDMVRALATRGYFLVLVIERFQSFASLADSATVSLLSQLRSLEHEFSLTTIVISSQDYATIRRRLPPDLAFVNSAYGDNHDHAVMPALTTTELATSATHLAEREAEEIFSIGTGPDAVFEALIDESRFGPAGLLNRTWSRTAGQLRAFAEDLFGQIGHDEIALFKAALANDMDAATLAYLRSLPLAGFLFTLDPGAPIQLKGELAQALARSLVPANAGSSAFVSLRLLICSANPDSDLDLEREVRAIRQMADACSRGDQVVIDAIWAVTPDDFVANLRRFRPTAVHFCGHGDVEGIVMRGDGDETHPVSGAALAQALRDRGIRLVVLNACYSQSQAEAVAPNVGAIIGTRRAVKDLAAIRFSTAFYRTLFAGEPLGAAFKDGRDALALYSLDDVYACHGDLQTLRF